MAAGVARARLLVEHDEVLAARAQRGDGALAPLHAQPEGVLVEGDRAVEVGDGEVHRAEPQRGGEHRG